MTRVLVIGALLALAGCGKAPPDFETVADKALNDLKAKNAAHEAAWGLGQAERWDLNQEDGRLVFTFPDKTVTCEAQIIGSFDKSQGTWLWSWENPSVLKPLTTASKRLQQFGAKHGYTKLTEAEWPATEEDAWEMVAVATLLGNAQGAYRGPAGDTYVFMTFGEPKIEPRQEIEPDSPVERQPDR